MYTEIIKDEQMASQVLEGFFAILPRHVLTDFRSLKTRKCDLREQEESFRLNGWETPEQLAESYHRRLLLSSEMSRISKLPDDLVLFAVTLTAHEIAELSCTASTGRGKLGELVGIEEWLEDSGQVEGIKKNAVLSEKLIVQIHDAVFLEVLERYGMKKYALIFEENRPLYEIRCEVGRRLISPDLVDKKEHLETLTRFRMLYGPEFAQEFLRRLREHDLLPD